MGVVYYLDDSYSGGGGGSAGKGDMRKAIYDTNDDGVVNESDVADKVKFGAYDIEFGIDSQGRYGYKKAGADTVTPFLDTSEVDATSHDIAYGTKSYAKAVKYVKDIDIFNFTRTVTYSGMGISFAFSTSAQGRTQLAINGNPTIYALRERQNTLSNNFIKLDELRRLVGNSFSGIVTLNLGYFDHSGTYNITNVNIAPKNTLYMDNGLPGGVRLAFIDNSWKIYPSTCTRFEIYMTGGNIMRCYFYINTSQYTGASFNRTSILHLNTVVCEESDEYELVNGYHKSIMFRGHEVDKLFFLNNTHSTDLSYARTRYFNLCGYRAYGICYRYYRIGSGLNDVTVELPFGTLVSHSTGTKTATHTLTPDEKYGTTAASFTTTITVADEDLFVWLIPMNSKTVLMFYRFRNVAASETVYSYSKIYTRMLTVGNGAAKISGEVSLGSNRTNTSTTAVAGTSYNSEMFLYKSNLYDLRLGITHHQRVTIYNSSGTTSDKRYFSYNDLMRVGSTSYGLRATAWTTIVNATDIATTYGDYSVYPLNLFGAFYTNQTTSANFGRAVLTQTLGGVHGAPVTTNITNIAYTANNGFTDISDDSIIDIAKINDGTFLALVSFASEVFYKFYLFNWDERNRVAQNIRCYEPESESSPSTGIYAKTVSFQKIREYNTTYTFINYIIVENMIYNVYKLTNPSIYVIFSYDLGEIEERIDDIPDGHSLSLTCQGVLYMNECPVKTTMGNDPAYHILNFFNSKKYYIDPYANFAFEFKE